MTANLAVPGSGSIAAGLKVGYVQAGTALAGFAITLIWGLGFMHWYVTNFSRIQELQMDDPGAALAELWLRGRWALLGFGVFTAALLWSIATGLTLLRRAKAREKQAPW